MGSDLTPASGINPFWELVSSQSRKKDQEFLHSLLEEAAVRPERAIDTNEQGSSELCVHT